MVCVGFESCKIVFGGGTSYSLAKILLLRAVYNRLKTKKNLPTNNLVFQNSKNMLYSLPFPKQ